MEKLIATLHAGPRHYGIVALSEGEEARERMYPRWHMEQVESDDIREVLHDALDTVDDPNNVAALNRILKQLDCRSLHAFGRMSAICGLMKKGVRHPQWRKLHLAPIREISKDRHDRMP
jgi:hypothetical protein